jgi:hypothetical protein
MCADDAEASQLCAACPPRDPATSALHIAIANDIVIVAFSLLM